MSAPAAARTADEPSGPERRTTGSSTHHRRPGAPERYFPQPRASRDGLVTAAAPGLRIVLPALGTTAVLVVTDPRALDVAGRVLRTELRAIDAACSRFRADSEISRLHGRAGSAVQVGPLLAETLTAALRAAELTGGLVDPTVGTAVAALGYDRDFARIDPVLPDPPPPPRPAPGWRRLDWDVASRTLLLPRGVDLDLGATAMALAADRIARRVADETGRGVLVSLGGDVAAAGEAPEGGWRVDGGDDHEYPPAEFGPVVTITGGGMATSGTTRRSWRRAGRNLHHIVDPRTGDVAGPGWRTVSVAAATCVDANTASTAAIVLGALAPDWLARHGVAARLVGVDGLITTTPGWPGDA